MHLYLEIFTKISSLEKPGVPLSKFPWLLHSIHGKELLLKSAAKLSLQLLCIIQYPNGCISGQLSSSNFSLLRAKQRLSVSISINSYLFGLQKEE